MKIKMLIACAGFAALAFAECASIPQETMERIAREVATPYKVGMVIAPEKGEKLDNPMVFRRNGRWYMMYIRFDGKGYETMLAESDDLLKWRKLGCVLPRGEAGTWDSEQADGMPLLLDPEWEGSNELRAFDGKYWMFYIGGSRKGYETDPLSSGIAFADDPSAVREWTRYPKNPVLSPSDADARPFERKTIYKHYVVEDPSRSLGARFVDYYNAKQKGTWQEKIGMAVSDDLVNWRRYGDKPVIDDCLPGRGGISGDPMIRRIGDVWVMFYFGCAWKPGVKGAFDTFACSRDLVHWTKWTGEPLLRPSEPYDRVHAHKPWVIKHNGVVYHFYCAVGDSGRGLALATSRRPAEIADAATAAAAAMPTLPEIGFELTLRQAVTNSPESKVSSSEMKSFKVNEKDGRTSLVWRGHPLCGDGFTVTAELAPTPERDGWAYSFRYAGNESGLHIRSIEFPAVTVTRTDATELFLPRDCGMIRRPDWKKAEGGAEVGKNGIHGVHFMAAMNGEGTSWYMDQRGDARLRMNRFLVRNGTKPHTLTMLFQYTPQLTDGNRVAGEMPFGGTIRTFKGGWFAAAEIYRRWAWEQPWARAAFARRQDKLRNIAIWFWNRGLSDEVAPPVERFRELTGLPVALDWYWWHAIPYDAGYPFFWPPREGEERFAATVRRLVEKGIFVQPYMNGISWDVKGPKWQEQGSLEAVVSAAGRTHGRQYNIFVPSGLTTMCGTAENFQTHMRGLVCKLRECGLSGVYLDQIGGWRTVVCECWNPAHPHPPGGGAMMTEGYRKFLRQAKAENPDFPISTEYTPEAYLDIVDSAIILFQNGECFGMSAMPEEETVPAFQAVYHGAITLYGSYAVIDGIPPWDPKWPPERRWKEEKAWEKLYPDQFALEFARGVAMGMQPMVHCLRMKHIDDPRYAADFAFTVDTAKFYHANLDYLYDGTMCAPGRLSCASQPVEVFARGIYTTRKKARVVRHPAVPTILHSVWRAKDGRVAAVLCNWSRKEQRYDLSTPDIAASGVIPARSWCLIKK